MNLNLHEYFGGYEHSNIDQILEYMKKMDTSLGSIYNFGSPFMKSSPEYSYIEYLGNCKLNEMPMSTDDTIDYIAPLFHNVPNWNNPGTMINIIPPVNLIAITASFFSTLYNSNFAQDTYAGSLINAELEVSKYMAELLGWRWQDSYGAFTFGGKGTNLYATKVALTKADPSTVDEGVSGKDFFMLTSKNAHPCHYEVCGWAGLGKNSCIEVPCDDNGKMNIKEAEKTIRKGIESGKVFIGFNLNGGSTNELYIDPIKEIHLLNRKIVKEYNLQYCPHIHVDAVLSWVYLFFNNYDNACGEINISKDSMQKIMQINSEVQELKYADSVGIDFHKTGFSPYISSLFIAKNREDFYAINNTPSAALEDLYFGNHNPYQSTLELTRSSLGPVSALATMKSLGAGGFRQIIASMFMAAENFRKILSAKSGVEIINCDASWLATFFLVKPDGFEGLDIDDMLSLDDESIDYIRQFNIDYAKYIRTRAGRGDVSFVFTSSRSYKIPGTGISLGALKAYPASPFLTVNLSEKIARDISSTIDKFRNEYRVRSYERTGYITDNMVYREKR